MTFVLWLLVAAFHFGAEADERSGVTGSVPERAYLTWNEPGRSQDDEDARVYNHALLGMRACFC
jgi:hypothetical protein